MKLSVVIPVYNSAAIFPELYRQLTEALQGSCADYEIIPVLDGCRDNSFEVIAGFALRNSRLKLVELSRNFGHQAAVTAGLALAAGDYVGVMDDDLEDPPEVLLQLYRKALEGFDVVYGIRRMRRRSLPHRLLYKTFYRVLRRLVDIEMPRDAGDFCVMTAQVAGVLNAMPERNRYLRGLRAWAGFRQTGVEYDRGARYASQSGYSFRQYLRLARDAVFAFSYKPLEYLAMGGIVIALLSFAAGAGLIFLKLTGRVPDVPGWVSLLVSVFFVSGVQMFSIGILGHYLARIYDEVKRRPNYIINRTMNLKGQPKS